MPEPPLTPLSGPGAGKPINFILVKARPPCDSVFAFLLPSAPQPSPPPLPSFTKVLYILYTQKGPG